MTENLRLCCIDRQNKEVNWVLQGHYVTNPNTCIIMRELLPKFHLHLYCLIPPKLGSHLMTPVYQVTGGSISPWGIVECSSDRESQTAYLPTDCRFQNEVVITGGFLKGWVSPTNPWVFLLYNDQHLGCEWGFSHHFRKHPTVLPKSNLAFGG